MADLISRADAIEAVEQAIFNHDSAIMRITALPSADAVSREELDAWKGYYNSSYADGFIDGRKSADMVSVVRCKDCMCEFICKQTVEQANAYDVEHRPLEWCSYGERKGGDNERQGAE